MAHWVRIAGVDECPPESAIERVVGDRIVALFHVGGTFYALDGICPHQGGPLAGGCLTGEIVTCPWHGWQFDVRTGQHQTSRTIVQSRCDVRVEGDEVFVDLESGH